MALIDNWYKLGNNHFSNKDGTGGGTGAVGDPINLPTAANFTGLTSVSAANNDYSLTAANDGYVDVFRSGYYLFGSLNINIAIDTKAIWRKTFQGDSENTVIDCAGFAELFVGFATAGTSQNNSIDMRFRNHRIQNINNRRLNENT